MLRKAYTERTPKKVTGAWSPPSTDTNIRSPVKEHKWKVLCQQADDLYLRTEYEDALLLYYRAQRERPNCSEARDGIRRCKDSIRTVLIEPINKVEATRNNTRQSMYSTARRTSTRTTNQAGTTGFSDWAFSLTRFRPMVDDDPHAPTVDMRHDAKHVMRLRSNKSYMRSIYDQLVKSILVKGDVELKKILREEMKFVKTRGYFWRHQIPIESVPKLFKIQDDVKEEEPEEKVMTSEEATELAAQHLIKILEAYRKEEFQEAIDLGKSSLSILDRISGLDVDYKDEVFASVYSVIGNSYFELDDIEPSIIWHEKDLKFSRKRLLEQGESRALGNLGRSHAKAGNFERAVELWTEKIPLCADQHERAWLYHELGYCYLTMKDYGMANQCGIMSFEAAQEIDDYEWQINSCVLIAQSEVAQDFLRRALETFNQAIYLCDICGNFDLKSNIMLGMHEISSIMRERGDDLTFLQEDFAERQRSRESVASTQLSFHSARSGAANGKPVTPRQKSPDRKTSENLSRHSERSFEHRPATKRRQTPNFKSSSHVTFDGQQKQQANNENKFKSRSVYFNDEVHVSLPSLPKTPVKARASRKSSQTSVRSELICETPPEDEPVKFPPIVQPANEKPKEVVSTEEATQAKGDVRSNTVEQQTPEKQEDNLFDDDEPGEYRSRSSYNLRGSSFYINTSSVGQFSREHSRLDSSGTMESTDPRNALTNSYDVINTGERETLSRQSRKSFIAPRDTLSRQSRKSQLSVLIS